jgi:nucleoside transporter
MLALHMLCFMPTLGLTNTISFHNVTNAQTQFPLIRVFGTIGWIAANWVVSKGFHADTTPQQFYIAGGAGIALGIYSLTLPHTPPPAAGRPFSARDALGLDALDLLRNPSFAIFMVCSFLICIPLAFYYSFAPVFAGKFYPDTAFYMSFGQVSEIVFMLVMPLFFSKLGFKWMLAAGMFAWAARYGLFAGAADQGIRWMVLAGIILHGICYDFFFVTGQIYVDKQAPAAIRGQAQGLLVLVTQGLGLGIGAQIAGRIVAANTTGAAPETVTDWRAVWIIPTAMAAVVLVVFIALFRDGRGKPATP